MVGFKFAEIVRKYPDPTALVDTGDCGIHPVKSLPAEMGNAL